ncbi:MAG TPA: AI-2E family transporter [Steroidobacteraceae bacterium]|nr:AI-2E family transporter [Steroidobacteraceae bacterium]
MNTIGETRSQLIGNAILLACVAALLWGTLAVLRPFLPAILWAGIIVVATWPIMLRMERWFGGRRNLAVAAMTGGLLVAVVAPVALLLGTLVTRLPELRDLAGRMLAGPWPGPPAWVARLPFGAELAAGWNNIVAQGPEHWTALAQPYLGKAALWLSQHFGTIGGITLEFLLTLALVVVFYRHGEALAQALRRMARRTGGARAEEGAVLAGQAMRAIAAGVVLTALVQSVLSGLGLWAAGLPAAGVLTSVVFMLCVMQIGPLPVLLPAVVWLAFQGRVAAAVVLGLWAVLIAGGDAFLRPWLIQRGAKLPVLLVLGGVIGGLLAFGLAGIFIGPILLAVVKRLAERWVADR